MELKAMMLIVALVLLGAAADHNHTLDGCQRNCGGVPIPYPFGIGKSSTTGKNCSLEESFEVICDKSTLLWGDIPVTAINIPKGQADMMTLVSQFCNGSQKGDGYNETNLTSVPSFTISSKDNKFISVGCDTYGYLNSFYGDTQYSTGCLTRCYDNHRIVNGSCSGIGCCQVDIPPGMIDISVDAYSFDNFAKTSSFNNCSYAFVVKNGNYTFSKDHLEKLPFKRVPVVFDWSVPNETCEASRKRGTNACKGNSTCVDSDTGYGYQCRCKEGYDGNPYHPDGCTDIDECKIGNHLCISDHNCRNIIGSHKCFCPKGQFGNGTKEGRCQEKNVFTKFVVGGSVGFITLFVVTFLLYLMYQKRKLIKLKEKFFKQNGGFILLQQLSARGKSSQTVQIFTVDELKKATNNYDKNLIIGRGGYGTVFKGFLTNNRIVAIKKSKIVNESQIEQFINEVVVLSQLNHRNVVKLLGCCLETEVPLLVYEFVNNGTLFDFIHNESKPNNLIWETRLRIATEAAGALSYLHSATSIPIVHRDVKSANILLDGTYTAKVSDFGASRFIPQDQTALATMVQGTIGYLDPEYMQTSQLTEKSDVYSFGVVLVELLIGEEPLSFDRSEEKRSLTIYFLSCLKEDRLFEAVHVGILNEKNEQEIKEVAILAAKCLRLKGEERPSMKEVAKELDGIRLIQKHPWTNGDNNLEETQCLFLQSSPKIFEQGESNSHQNGRYDSINDQVPSSLTNGR